MPYDLDRRSLGDTLRYPSLAEMTETAIRNLENPNGFVLMAVSYTHLDVYKRQYVGSPPYRTHGGSD